MKPTLLAVAAALACSHAALAQSDAPSADQTVVTLTSGDTFRGTLVSDGEIIVLNHPVLGELRFPRTEVASVRTMAADDASKATAAAAAAAGKVPPPPPPPDPDSFWKGWSGSASLGLNGASGNTETLSLRGALSFARQTTKTKTTAELSYNYGTDDGDVSKDNGRFDVRNDWLPQGESKWRPFVQGTLEYDTFQDWDYRYSAYAGVGYELLKNDKYLVLPRAGLGLSQELGGTDNKIHFEGLLGIDFAWTIDDRSKFFASLDTFWLLDEIPDYRALLKAGYEIVVDPDSNLSLKLGIEDRYDSSPGEGKNRNDLTYFALLVYNF